jgi:hypothetical protein
MTSQRSLRIKSRILNAFSPSIAMLTVLIALPASAQQADAGRSPTQSSAALFDAGSPLFLPAVNYISGGIFATQVAVADVNGDGKPDLIVGNGFNGSIPGNGGVGVLLGNGDGTFRTAVTHDTGGPGSFVNGVVVTDVNGDGKPDLIVANSCVYDSYCLTGSTVAVLLGNGDGSFQPPLAYSSGGTAFSLKVADVNDDGKPDIVVANSDGSVGVLLGNGDGTFQPAQTYGAGGTTGSYSVAVLDVNGDGKLDVVVSVLCFAENCANDGGAGVLLGNGDGTFQPVVTYPSQGLATSVAAADVNNDGKPDLVVTNEGHPGTIAVLLGSGDGVFQSAVTYSAGGYPSSVVIADVNGDGTPDLVVALDTISGTYIQTGAAGVLLGNGDGTFQSVQTLGTLAYLSEFVAVADVNGDGRPDVLVVNQWGSSPNGGTQPGSVSVLLNNPQSPTTTTLVSSPNPSLVRQAVIFTATVSSKAGTPPNGGTVTFSNGSVLGTAPLRGGTASLKTSSFLQGGTFTITASYAGDANFAASS